MDKREFKIKLNKKYDWITKWVWLASLEEAIIHANEKFGKDNVIFVKDFTGKLY